MSCSFSYMARVPSTSLGMTHAARASLSDGGLFGLDRVVEERFFQRDDRDLELLVVRLFGGDALEPEAGGDEHAAGGAVEVARGEADDFVREAGDERDQH